MPLHTTGDSRSLRRQANRLELRLAGRQRTLRLRVVAVKQAMVAGSTSPAMLLAAFGAGVVLEQSVHRPRALTYLLNASDAGVRLLESLLSAIRAIKQSRHESSLDRVKPV